MGAGRWVHVFFAARAVVSCIWFRMTRSGAIDEAVRRVFGRDLYSSTTMAYFTDWLEHRIAGLTNLFPSILYNRIIDIRSEFSRIMREDKG